MNRAPMDSDQLRRVGGGFMGYQLHGRYVCDNLRSPTRVNTSNSIGGQFTIGTSSVKGVEAS